MVIAKLVCTLLVAVCIVNAYGPIKGGKKHRTTTPFPPEVSPLPSENANSILGEPQSTSSSSSSSSGSFWWQGNNPFSGAAPIQQPSLPSQPQQPPLSPQQPSLPPQQPSLPSQQPPLLPQQPSLPPQQPSLPSQPQQPLPGQGNPFLSGLKQPCTAANHFCVQKQLCHDGLIVSQSKPLQAFQGQCDVGTQICCKLALSSQPGVVTGQVNQGPTYGGVGQTQQPGFVSVQPGQQDISDGSFGRPQQPGIITGSPGLTHTPGLIYGPTVQPQQPGSIPESADHVKQPGIVHVISGKPQQPGLISGHTGNIQNPSFIYGPSGQPQRIETIYTPTGQAEQPGLIHGSSGNPQQPGFACGQNGQSGVICGSSGQIPQPGSNGSPQFITGSTNTQQTYRPSPGSNGVPIGGSIFDAPSVTPNPSQKPYTGPLNTTPYPGCAAALKCVRESFCTAEGIMSNVQVTLTREQYENKVPLTDCVDPDTGVEGKCCRDPNYKDPWPAGMMMPNGHNDGHQTLPDECSPFGKCLHSYQCGEQNTIRPLKSCRVPLDGASGVCCSSAGSILQNGQQILSTGASSTSQSLSTGSSSSNSQSLSSSAQNQIPLDTSVPSISLGNNPFISQAGLNPESANTPPSFQVQQPQTQYQPQNSGKIQPLSPTDYQNKQPVVLPGTQPVSTLQTPKENVPNTYYPSQPGYQKETSVNTPASLPGLQQQPNAVFPTQTQQVTIPGIPIQTQQVTIPGVPGQTQQVIQPGVPTQTQQVTLPGLPTQTHQVNHPGVPTQTQQVTFPGIPTQQVIIPEVPTQTQQVIIPGIPTQTQVQQLPGITSKPQLTVPAATGQDSVILIQPPRTYPSPPVSAIGPQPIPGEKCGVRRQVSRVGLSKSDCGFGEFPWQALIVDNNNQSALCSGAIIAPNAVVTTAHCIDKVESSDILVKAGLWRLNQINQPRPVQVSSVAAKSVHPKFDGNSLFNDMAILILNDPFIPDQNVDFICLPEASSTGPQNSCVATGWGKTALQGNSPDDVLHQVPVQFVPEADCQTSFRSTFLGAYFQLHNSFQCALPMSPDTDLCKVGAGGPVACEPGDGRYVLRGLYSWDLGCGSAVTPTAISRLDAAWLRAILNTPVEVLLAEDERRQELSQQQLDVFDADDKPGFSQGYGRK